MTLRIFDNDWVFEKGDKGVLFPLNQVVKGGILPIL